MQERKRKIIDLTGPLVEGTQMYGGVYCKHLWLKHVPLQISTVYTFREGAPCLLHEFRFDGECGTHIVAPGEFYEPKKWLNEMPLESFIGDAVIVDVPKKGGEAITADELEKALDEADYKNGEIVLVHTGWGDAPEVYKRWFTRDYVLRGPYMTNEAAQLVVRKNIKTFGSDMTMLDIYTSPDWKPYRTLAGGDVCFIEALVALNLPPKRFLFVALPLSVPTVSFPVRAIAIIE